MKFKNYKSTPLRQEIDVTELYTVHYYEYPSDFVFRGEAHNFWELMCVDSGAVEVVAGSAKYVMESGSIIFHKPNEFHALRAYGGTTPNLIVASFGCDSPAMSFFEGKVLSVNDDEKRFLSNIIAAASSAFTASLNQQVNPMRPNPNAVFGSEQIIKITLEMLLINLRQRYSATAPLPRDRNFRDTKDTLIEQVDKYLMAHIYEKFTVEDICRDNSISRSYLQKIYHTAKGFGVMEHVARLKIDTAKKLIRENRYSYSEIAAMLNYSSYQHFSLQFRKFTHMSPSEYRASTRYYYQYVPPGNKEK